MDFTKLFVKIDNWFRLFVKCFESFKKGVHVVIGTARSLSSFRASCNQGLFRDIIEDNVLAFGNVLFKVDGLLDRSWEAIDEVVL